MYVHAATECEIRRAQLGSVRALAVMQARVGQGDTCLLRKNLEHEALALRRLCRRAHYQAASLSMR